MSIALTTSTNNYICDKKANIHNILLNILWIMCYIKHCLEKPNSALFKIKLDPCTVMWEGFGCTYVNPRVNRHGFANITKDLIKNERKLDGYSKLLCGYKLLNCLIVFACRRWARFEEWRKQLFLGLSVAFIETSTKYNHSSVYGMNCHVC